MRAYLFVITLLVLIFGGIAGYLYNKFSGLASMDFTPPPATVAAGSAVAATWPSSLEAVGTIQAVRGVELAAEASMDLLSMNLAGRLSTKAGQGLGSGLMNARLGLRAMRLLRPIPFHAEEVPRIGELRAELFSRMRKADKGEDDPS